jgi:hypothetical protein
MRWIARLCSVVVSGSFLLVLFLAFTNEDKPQGMAILLLTLLALTIMACFAAWRWERVGGGAVIIGTLGTSVAALLSSLTLGLGWLSFLPSLIYGVPFLVVGILFLASRQQAMTGSTS